MSGSDGAKAHKISPRNVNLEVRRPRSAGSDNFRFRRESREVKRRRWPEKQIAAIGARQRALITHQQLTELGVSKDAIRRAVERGRLYRLYRGVYALVPPAALPPLAVEQAAVLACGPGAYLSHHSAAMVWGIRPARASEVDVTVVGRAPAQRAGIRIHRVARVDPRDVRNYRGIAITSPARTVLDIANDLTPRETERAFDEAIARRLMTRAAVRVMLLANGHRAGVGHIRALASAERATTMTRSEAEEAFLKLVRKAGLPEPQVNARVGRFEVDFCWSHERVIVEIDGFAFHSSRAALERDHRRDAELQQRGFCVVRISWRELRHQPERVVAYLARALTLRAA